MTTTTIPPSFVTGTLNNLAPIEAALVELRKGPKGILGAAMGGMTVTLIVSQGPVPINGTPAADGATNGATGATSNLPPTLRAKLPEIRAWGRQFRAFTSAQLRDKFGLKASEEALLGKALIAEGFIGKSKQHVGYPVVGGAGRPAAPSPSPSARRRAPGEKRSQDEIAAITAALQRGIEAHPGSNISALKRLVPELAGCSTEDLGLPLDRLRDAKAYYTEGERRGTTYWPTKGKAKAKAPSTSASSGKSPKKTKAKVKAKAAKPKSAQPATKPAKVVKAKSKAKAKTAKPGGKKGKGEGKATSDAPATTAE